MMVLSQGALAEDKDTIADCLKHGGEDEAALENTGACILGTVKDLVDKVEGLDCFSLGEENIHFIGYCLNQQVVSTALEIEKLKRAMAAQESQDD